jgi:hypothetical protein
MRGKKEGLAGVAGERVFGVVFQKYLKKISGVQVAAGFNLRSRFS